MATISIEYGKMKSDGSCSVMLRIRSAKTEKRLNIGVTLEKAEYKIYPDGRRKITNDNKYFLVQDLLSDYTKKFNAFIQKMVGYEITAEEIYSFLTKKSESDVKMMNESIALFAKALKQGEITALVYYEEINNIYQKLQRHIDLHCQSTKLLAELHKNEL